MYEAIKTNMRQLGRPRHAVSTKVAFFNETKDKILMTCVPHGGFGLPGGHIDSGEHPDAALEREIFEELGLNTSDYTDVVHHTFFRAGTRIILLYTGNLHSATAITLDPKEIKGTVWVSYDDIQSGRIPAGTYTEHIKALLAPVE